MENKDGSKLMTGYILVCFVLAAGAMIGYKIMNDKREALASEYISVGKKYVEIRDYQSRSLHNYYKDSNRVNNRHEKEKRASETVEILEKIAQGIGIDFKGRGENDKLSVTPFDKLDQVRKETRVYTLKIELDRVTAASWKYFIRQSRQEIGDYATMQELRIVRSNNKFEKMTVLSKRNSDDSTRWKVTITYKWFIPEA